MDVLRRLRERMAGPGSDLQSVIGLAEKVKHGNLSTYQHNLLGASIQKQALKLSEDAQKLLAIELVRLQVEVGVSLLI